jgi:uncharacterized membrane protein
MTLARRWCALGAVALLALQPLWHVALAPPRHGAIAATVLGALPILPALVLFVLRHRRAPFWAAVAGLLYVCHGVMEAWTDRSVWPLGVAEAALAAWVVVAASWDGMRARFRRKAPAAPPAESPPL